ncbi:MAG: hypothetical protein ACK4OE_09435 [Acidovorax sp.]|uniref:hypothetical protein n=1 Tax=Acidovorax sp. TaxID=1872122 RepID=UPI00391D99D3
MTRARAHPPAATAQLALPQASARRAGLGALFHGQTSRQLWAQAALVWLLLALVVVPTLGRLHQVMHAPVQQTHALSASHALAFAEPGAGADTSAGHAHTHGDTADEPAAHAHSLLDALLAHHAPVDCLLLDQLALGDALHSAPAALAAPVTAQAPLVHPAATAAARHVALFHARGPPVVG